TNVVTIGFTTLVLLYTRSPGVAYFTAGAVFCTLSVKSLKKIIRQPRPPNHMSSKPRDRAAYGMPSTHSGAICYFATYIPLACMYLPIHPTLPQNYIIVRVIPPFVIILYAFAVACSRVWLGKHTWPQVIVGCSYGIVFALLWYSAWVHGLEGRVNDVLHSLQEHPYFI
ncbi:PAP2-domain-containing protein, partial [Fistulina hepatica ATCC 64428]